MARATKKGGTEQVNEFMSALDHPFKAEVEAVRASIMGVAPGITEAIKWSAPTFSYKGYILTIHLRSTDRIHLIFHNGAILPNHGGLMEGDYVDRRMVYFTSMADWEAKREAFEQIIQAWVDAMDGNEIA